MITRNEKKPAGETLVAFFAGTGYDVGIAEQPNNNFYNNRYLSTNRVKSKSSHAKNCDIGFSDLQYSLANRNNCFAYDGCHRRGGGLFAFGVVEPATHLYRELKSRLEGKNQKMTLVLTAHSRGCLSALILAKKINKDSQLRNKVNIILDLRDPVPGNLNVSTKLDFAKIATISGQLNDLRACENIKAAHITVQEKGIHSVGFYVLIPHFHPSTQLDIDAIPGLHDIQETPLFPLDKASSKFLMDENNRYLARNNHLYLLGLLQSWKIYLNNQVALNYSAILDNGVLRNFILHLQENPEQHLEMLSNFEALQNSMRNHAAPEIIKSQVTQLIDSLQLKIYHTTLLRYQAEEMVYNKKRLLHYDGEFLAINSAQQANCLNFRHAKLVYQNNPESPEPKMMIGFKGRRHDLNLHERAAQKIEELRRLIQRQEGYLPRHWLALQRLSHILSAPTQPSDPERHIKKLASFAQAFHECKVAFDDPKNQAIHRFFRILGHALASFGSLGIYALIKAKQSQEQRGSWKFWKTHKEIFIEKAEAVSKYSAPVEMKLQY